VQKNATVWRETFPQNRIALIGILLRVGGNDARNVFISLCIGDSNRNWLPDDSMEVKLFACAALQNKWAADEKVVEMYARIIANTPNTRLILVGKYGTDLERTAMHNLCDLHLKTGGRCLSLLKNSISDTKVHDLINQFLTADIVTIENVHRASRLLRRVFSETDHPQ
jgi:hypothetical protein